MVTVTVNVPAETVPVPAETVPYTITVQDALATLQPLGYVCTPPSVVTPPPAQTPVDILRAYLMTLGANKGGIVAAQTLNPYVNNPLTALDTTPGVSLPTVTVNKPGPQTGLLPGMLDLMMNENQPNGCIMPSNAPPNDTISLANNGLAAGCLIRINGNPPNPSGANNNPWPDVLTTGSTVQKAFLAGLAADAAKMRQINGAFIYDFMGEMNLQGGLDAGNNWASAGTCTSAQFAALWVLMWNELKVNQGLADKIFISYEVNDGVGQYTFGYPGSQYVDGVGIHTWADFSATEAPYTALLAAAPGKPICFGSCGLTYQSVPNFSGNNFTQVCEVIAAKYPLIYAAVFWCLGGNALSQEDGAEQCLSTPPWLNRNNIPKFS